VKSVLVTGGLGFIGSWLVEMLINSGVEVDIVDNRLSNTIEPEEANCKCYLVPISDFKFEKKYDVIFHLASYVGPVSILKYAGSIGYGILKDTMKLIDYCVDNNCLLIDLSTSEIYGASGIFQEDSEKLFPALYEIRTEYGAGKMLAEMSVVNRAKIDSKLSYHIIRPFNVSGPRQRPEGGFVLPRFVVAALTGQPVTVYGDGKQERAFTDVRDMCSAILDVVGSIYYNETWNVGNPFNKMSIKSLANRVKMAVNDSIPNKEVKVEFVDPKIIHGDNFSEANSRTPDSKKINDLLNWRPQILFSKTLDDLIDYYKDRIEKGYSFNVWSR